MKSLLLPLSIVIYCIFLPSVSANVFISEIMYDPQGSDEGYEWVELYSNTSVNISGWVFFENNVDHRLTLINGSWEFINYAIIADDPLKFLEKYPYFNGTLFASSFSLRNSDGEYIAIKNTTLGVIDSLNYSTARGGKENSLEKIDLSLVNDPNNWGSSLITLGTPGQENSLKGSCDWSISLIMDKTIWEVVDESVEVHWKIKVDDDKNNSIAFFDYWIEDLNGNIVKEKTGKAANHSSLFGPFRKTFSQPGGYLLFGNITSTSCPDYNLHNNVMAQPVIVKSPGNMALKLNTSFIVIEQISPSSPTTDDTINVKATLYRGETRKHTLSAYLENSKGRKASEKLSFDVETKFINYTLTFPLFLKEPCGASSGKYRVIVEGLDAQEAKEIEFKRKSCAETEKKDTKNSDKKTQHFEIVTVNPPSLQAGNMAHVLLEINNEGEEKNYAAWGYIYRGNRCYSCLNETTNRDRNQQVVEVGANNQKIVKLDLPLDYNLKEGEYTLKVKVQRQGQKTAKEIIKKVYIQQSLPREDKKIKNSSSDTFSSSVDVASPPQKTFPEELSSSKRAILPAMGIVVYESNTEQTKKITPYILLVSFGLLAGILFLKRN